MSYVLFFPLGFLKIWWVVSLIFERQMPSLKGLICGIPKVLEKLVIETETELTRGITRV
jgi:hypothetical protein